MKTWQYGHKCMDVYLCFSHHSSGCFIFLTFQPTSNPSVCVVKLRVPWVASTSHWEQEKAGKTGMVKEAAFNQA